MEFTLYESTFHNCKHLVVSSMLKRVGFVLDNVWYQAGIVYKESEQDFLLEPYYSNVITEVQMQGATGKVIELEEVDAFLEAMREVVQKGHSLGVFADIYELTYCSYYQENHESHAFEVLNVEGDEWLVADHYYKYYGNVSTEVLKRSLISHFEQGLSSNYYCFYFESHGSILQEMDAARITQIIEGNLNVMEGNLELETTGETIIVGLAGIEVFSDKVQSILRMDPDTSLGLLEKCFNYAKEMADSRYHFHLFLNRYSHPGLAEVVMDASQSWRVITNMILRAIVTKDYDSMRDRIAARFERVRSQEQDVVAGMQQLLLSITAE